MGFFSWLKNSIKPVELQVESKPLPQATPAHLLKPLATPPPQSIHRQDDNEFKDYMKGGNSLKNVPAESSNPLKNIPADIALKKIFFDELGKPGRIAEKARLYIRDKFKAAGLDCPDQDVSAIKDFISGKSNKLSGEVFAAKVEGIPIYEIAETHKNDLPMMLRCCKEELKNMARTGQVAAPFCFKRAAILAKKAKNYELEIKICELLKAAYTIYHEAYKNQGEKLLGNMDELVTDMGKRIEAAKKNMDRLKTAKPKAAKGKTAS